MIAVDVGGTFTDVVALEDGRIRTAKVSTDPTTASGRYWPEPPSWASRTPRCSTTPARTASTP